VLSAAMAVTGIALAWTTAPGPAHLMYQLANRTDGVKMLLLAGLAAAAAAAPVLPRWLRWTAAATSITITVSGVLYLLLVQSTANLAAAPALILLLAFITGTGLVLGARQADR
jgi:hypothetical protein